MAFDQNQYINDWKRRNYDEVRVLIPKGKKETIEKMAKVKGLSVSRFIVEALENHYKLDLSK